MFDYLRAMLIASVPVLFMSVGSYAFSTQDTVNLYATPNGKHVTARVPITASLVPIYRQHGWVKVGNRQDGTVGWISLKQYHRQRAAYFKPDVQTIFINRSVQDGKPTVSMVAYKDGKKLTDKEASALYEKMAKSQQREQRAMRHYWHHFDRMMRLQREEMQHWFDHDAQDPFLYMMPGPVIQAPEAHKK